MPARSGASRGIHIRKAMVGGRGAPGRTAAPDPAPVPGWGKLAWLICALLAAGGAYGISRFELRPLDSPGTLHALLWPVFAVFWARFPIPQAAAHAFARLCFAAIVAPLALALINYLAAGGVLRLRGRLGRIVRSPKLFFLAVALCLLICRFPLLTGLESNPDESEFTSAAMKLFVDPVYFRADDCNTSGPLNIYPLMLPALAGLSPDFASSRLVGLILIFLSIYVLYRALKLVATDSAARLGVLPAVAFFSLVTHPDFVHYSSEHVSLLLISLAVFAVLRVVSAPEFQGAPFVLLGFLGSAAFFAKMQAAPIVALAAAVALAYVYIEGHIGISGRPFGLLAAGFAPLMLLHAVVCWAAGLWRDFWVAYIVANWSYTRAGGNFVSELPRLASEIVSTREFQFFILVFLVVLAAAVWAAIRRRGREPVLFLEMSFFGALVAAGGVYIVKTGGPEAHPAVCAAAFVTVAAAVVFLAAAEWTRDRRRAWVAVLSGALLAGPVVSLYAPHHFLPHYLLLFTIPVCATMGLLLAGRKAEPGVPAAKARWSAAAPRISLAALFAASIAGWVWWRIPAANDNFYAAQGRTGVEEGNLIASLTAPGSTIVVWGWNPKLYLSSGRPPATRDTNMSRFFLYGKALNDFYRDRFLRDLRRRPAELFVDAIDTSCCYLNDRKTQGFESIPAIGAYVHARYILAAEAYRERLYIRRDLAGFGAPKPCAAGAISCYQSASGGPRELPPAKIPDHAVIEIAFTPLLEAQPSATVFRIDPAGSSGGMRLESVGSNRYRLGIGGRTFSTEIEALPKQKMAMTIELTGKEVRIACNGTPRDRFAVPGGFPDTGGPVVLGSDVEGRRFTGAIDSFEIRRGNEGGRGGQVR